MFIKDKIAYEIK